MAELVQLKVFNGIAEAQIAKAKLEAHDIPVFLFDEHLGGNLYAPVALPGFRLMVAEDCLEEAARILEADPLPRE